MKPNKVTPAQVELVRHGGQMGSVARRLLAANMNVDALRPYREMHANALLRHEEWQVIDDAVLKIATDRMVGVADLIARNLTFNLTNGLGTTVLAYETESDMESAELSMDGATRGEKDRPEFGIGYLPLPIIHKDFSFNIRQLEASRSRGEPLDTTGAEIATRKVVEMAEQILFIGASAYAYGGGTIRGYMDHPSRQTVTLSTNWDDSPSDGESILADVISMIEALHAVKMYGDYGLYVPNNFGPTMFTDFKANSDLTVQARIEEIEPIQFVRTADFLTNDNVILVQLTSDVVREVIGMNPTPLEWDEEGGMILNFKVMAIMVPQIRADADSNCGVCHLS